MNNTENKARSYPKIRFVISEWMEDAKIAIDPLRPIPGNPLVDIENLEKCLHITCRGSNEPNGLRGWMMMDVGNAGDAGVAMRQKDFGYK